MNHRKLLCALGISTLLLHPVLAVEDKAQSQLDAATRALIESQDLIKSPLAEASKKTQELLAQGRLINEENMADPNLVYKNLSLKQAVEIALQNNLSFQSAFTDLEVARRSESASEASLLEPSLSLEAGRDRVEQPSVRTNAREDSFSASYNQTFQNAVEFQASAERNISRDAGNSSSSNVYNARLSRAINGESDRFLDLKLSIDLAGKEQQIAYHNYMDAYQELVFEVVSSFLKAIKDYQQIEVSDSVLDYRRELLELTRVKYNLGVSTRLDVLRVEVQVAQQEERIIAARNRYENSRDTLLNLMNYEKASNVSLNYEHAESNRDYQQDWYLDQALEKRHDLAATRLQLEQQKLREHTAFAKKDPKLNANLNYRDGRFIPASTGFNAPGQDYSEWGASLSYDLPMGNRAKKERLSIEKLRTQNEVRRVEEVEDNVSLAVKNSIRDLVATHKRIKVLQKNVEQAEENLKLSQLSYEKGIKALIDVLDSQDDLLEVKTSYVNSILDLKVAEMALLRACGLIEAPESIQLEAMQRAGIDMVQNPMGVKDKAMKQVDSNEDPWELRRSRRR